MGESKEHSSGRERNERLFYKLLIDNNMEDLLPVVYIPTELEFIHKSSSIVGYRPNIFSTTLSHLIATNSYHFLIPFIPIRDKLEEFFNCQYELFVEFTALIRWSRGASIGWHSDDNRPYLKQRHFAVVCYLNNYGKDFNGGLFRFQDGQPMSIMPMAGDVLIYTADQHNIHSVDEVYSIVLLSCMFDYIVHDCRACGLGCNFQPERLMETMQVIDNEIRYRAKDC
ncbi:hypothetical protein AHAS_Ahas18G0103500 [Arachis hypogaea]